MNTKQLITIWYTGLLIIVALLLQNNDWALIISIVIVGSLFVLSFRLNDNVNKKAVLAWVGIPMLLFITLFTVATYTDRTRNEPHALPIEQRQKVEGSASITNYGYLKVDLYNGSSWRIEEVQIGISVIHPDGSKAPERIYTLVSYGDGLPYKNTDYSANLGFKLAPNESFKWQIKSLRGVPQ